MGGCETVQGPMELTGLHLKTGYSRWGYTSPFLIMQKKRGGGEEKEGPDARQSPSHFQSQEEDYCPTLELLLQFI